MEMNQTIKHKGGEEKKKIDSRSQLAGKTEEKKTAPGNNIHRGGLG